MPRLSVRQLFDDRRERLGLSWAAGKAGASREFTGEMLRKPGVGLIGHLNLIHPLLAQVIGPRELEYLDKLDRVVLKHKERFAPRHATGIKRMIPAP